MVFAPGVQVSGYMCMVAGCRNPVHAGGLCRHHYDRNRYAGNPVKPDRSRLCPCCTNWFVPERVDQVFCCGRCRSRYKRLSDKDPVRYPPRPRTPLFTRQVDAVDVEPVIRVETFTDEQVVAKCDGLCQVCGRPVDLDVLGPDGPAFMWKVPLEKSRQATLRNRLLVHERCRGGTP